MGTRFHLARWLPWALALALLPAAIIAFPGPLLNRTARLPSAETRPEASLPTTAPSRSLADLASRPDTAQPVNTTLSASRRNERKISDDQQRRLMMYLI